MTSVPAREGIPAVDAAVDPPGDSRRDLASMLFSELPSVFDVPSFAWGFGGLHGGLALSIVASSMRRKVPEHSLRSITGQFHRPIRETFAIESKVIRSGRNAGAVQATGSGPDGICLTATAIFGSEQAQGVPVYYVDPGINGTHRTVPNTTSSVEKYDAPKATLMSYIIKGILNQKLPWGLVLLGVMIAIVLEMSGIPSLAFAVGVYLPLSSSSPIFIGGMIRWLVDKYLRVKFKGKNLTEGEFVAETDKSPGVLMASGYIAGGALAAVWPSTLISRMTISPAAPSSTSVSRRPRSSRG